MHADDVIPKHSDQYQDQYLFFPWLFDRQDLFLLSLAVKTHLISSNNVDTIIFLSKNVPFHYYNFKFFKQHYRYNNYQKSFQDKKNMLVIRNSDKIKVELIQVTYYLINLVNSSKLLYIYI